MDSPCPSEDFKARGAVRYARLSEGALLPGVTLICERDGVPTHRYGALSGRLICVTTGRTLVGSRPSFFGPVVHALPDGRELSLRYTWTNQLRVSWGEGVHLVRETWPVATERVYVCGPLAFRCDPYEDVIRFDAPERDWVLHVILATLIHSLAFATNNG